MRITKIHFGHCVGRYDPPSTELPRDYCAGIGPLQLGVVLVCYDSIHIADVLLVTNPCRMNHSLQNELQYNNIILTNQLLS